MAEEKTYYDGYLINFSSSTGYPTIFIDGRNKLLHRYVWEKHYGKIKDGFEIHHKDKNRHNYSLDNLELVSSYEHHKNHAKENLLGINNKGKKKNYLSGFCGKKHALIAKKDNVEMYFDSIYAASSYLNIRAGDIWRILKGKRKSAKGWSFIDGN